MRTWKMQFKDSLTIPNIVTIFRLGLFFVFVYYLFQNDFLNAFIFFTLAWALDAVDGYLARTLHQESVIGYQLDKIVDRTIIFFGILFFIRAHYLPPQALFLLTKDIALLPAITMQYSKHKQLEGLGLPGKILTLMQGVGILWLLVGLPFGNELVALIAVSGGIAAVMYLRRIA